MVSQVKGQKSRTVKGKVSSCDAQLVTSTEATVSLSRAGQSSVTHRQEGECELSEGCSSPGGGAPVREHLLRWHSREVPDAAVGGANEDVISSLRKLRAHISIENKSLNTYTQTLETLPSSALRQRNLERLCFHLKLLQRVQRGMFVIGELGSTGPHRRACQGWA